MKKLIFLFILLLSFTLYPAAVPQGLIKEEKNGVTRITTTNPNFKLVMEIYGNDVELKWESIFKNDKGFIYSSPSRSYDYGETISDFGSYKLFTVPIEDFGQVITSPGGYVVPAPYVIDVDHPVYSVNNIRYLIYAFILDPLESTELYGYRAGIYAQSAYITLNKKDMEEVKRLLEYYIDYTKENNINIFQDYNGNKLNYDEVFNLLKNQYQKVQEYRNILKEEKKEYEDRFQIVDNILIYNGDEIIIEANIEDYKKYLQTCNKILAETEDYNKMTDYMETQKDFRYYLTLEKIRSIRSIEFQHTEYKVFNVYSNDRNKNKIAINFLPYTQNEIKIDNRVTTLFTLLSDNDKNAINRDFWGKLYDASK